MINHLVSQQDNLDGRDTPREREFSQHHTCILNHPEASLDAPGATLETQCLQHVDPNEKEDHLVESGNPSRQSAKAAIDTSPEKTAFNMPTYGNGSIFKSKNRSGKIVWKVNISLGFDQQGKRKRTQRTAHTYSGALQLQREMLSLALKGDLVQKTGETLQEYSLWWLKTVKSHRVKASTLTDYEDRLQRYIFGKLGRKQLSDITVRDVETWLFELRKMNLATATINGARQVLGSVLKHANRQGLIPKNPVDLTERMTRQPSEIGGAHNPWSLEEAQRAIHSSVGTEFDLFMHLALFLGLRRGEILGIQWEDFDFPNVTLEIKRTLKELRTLNPQGKGTTQLVLDTPKTRSSSRILVLPIAVQEAVKRHIRQQEKKVVGEVVSLVGPVFLGQNGSQVHPSNFAKKLHKFSGEQGLRRIRIHDLRHTAATLGLESGVRIESVSQALGHSRIDVTKSIYAPYVQKLSNEFTYGLSQYLNSKAPTESDLRPLEALAI